MRLHNILGIIRYRGRVRGSLGQGLDLYHEMDAAGDEVGKRGILIVMVGFIGFNLGILVRKLFHTAIQDEQLRKTFFDVAGSGEVQSHLASILSERAIKASKDLDVSEGGGYGALIAMSATSAVFLTQYAYSKFRNRGNANAPAHAAAHVPQHRRP